MRPHSYTQTLTHKYTYTGIHTNIYTPTCINTHPHPQRHTYLIYKHSHTHKHIHTRIQTQLQTTCAYAHVHMHMPTTKSGSFPCYFKSSQGGNFLFFTWCMEVTYVLGRLQGGLLKQSHHFPQQVMKTCFCLVSYISWCFTIEKNWQTKRNEQAMLVGGTPNKGFRSPNERRSGTEAFSERNPFSQQRNNEVNGDNEEGGRLSLTPAPDQRCIQKSPEAQTILKTNVGDWVHLKNKGYPNNALPEASVHFSCIILLHFYKRLPSNVFELDFWLAEIFWGDAYAERANGAVWVRSPCYNRVARQCLVERWWNWDSVSEVDHGRYTRRVEKRRVEDIWWLTKFFMRSSFHACSNIGLQPKIT